MANPQEWSYCDFSPHRWLWASSPQLKATRHLVFKSFSSCPHLHSVRPHDQQSLCSFHPGRCATYLWYVVASLLTNGVKPSEAKQRLSSGQDATLCTSSQQVQRPKKKSDNYPLALALAAENHKNEKTRELRREAASVSVFAFGELTFTDLLWSPGLVRPQEVLLESRRSLGVRHKNEHVPTESQEAFGFAAWSQ